MKERRRCSRCGDEGHNVQTCQAKTSLKSRIARAKNAEKAGRPVEHKMFERFADLERPPLDDPLKMDVWTKRLLVELVYYCAKEPVPDSFVNKITRIAGASQKLTSAERLLEAEETVKRNALKTKPRRAGPRPGVPVPGSKPLR